MFSKFHGTISENPQPARKPKKARRAQVQRACDGCRLGRVKCDTSRPCRNCIQSGRQCVFEGSTEFRGLNTATIEIDRLRQRVQDLEAEREQRPSQPAAISPALVSPPSSDSHHSTSVSFHPVSEKWKGTTVEGIRYGPLSLQYFSERISRYLEIDADPRVSLADFPVWDTTTLVECCDGVGKMAQDHFLDLHWLCYHVNYPALDESEFRELYASLWHTEEASSTRRPDPLVDIVLAMNIQYALSFMPQDETLPRQPAEHSCLGGSAFYQRCKSALDKSMDSPTIKTVQCHLFCAIYLSYAGYHNAADTTIKLAECSLSMLSLDHDDSPPQELVSRIRNCLRTLQTRFSMRLGRFERRPFCMAQQALEVTTPSSTIEFNWFVFHEQVVHLCTVVEDIATTFLGYCNQILDTAEGATDLYSDPIIRDKCALFMKEQMNRLKTWSAQVPAQLRIPRKGYMESFSTRRAPLEFDDSDPQWLQRQRVVLECQYHDFCVTLLRVFFHFSPKQNRGTFNSDENGISCVNHAYTLTSIIHQIHAETDILTGCYQAFEWQQNAVYALAAFAAANPLCPPTPSARKALGLAGEVFGSYGDTSIPAMRMRELISEFEVKIAEKIANFRGGPTPGPTPRSVQPVEEPSLIPQSDVAMEVPSQSVLGPVPLGDSNIDWSIVGGSTEQWWSELDQPTQDLWSTWMKEFEP
ncbi:unnamed protein product [Clonostachys byssicola]|uniref:Zn(2)-C6 fungal-type domain-containing protein n=1 Tax=Clonostachys byssicola TaxID=160290 RepID=A0A9N9V0T6_9HYPO|nr:unnamed protein product [Clonostachys byssicola]